MTALPLLRAAAVLAACAAAQTASAACYYLYAPDNELIYRSNRTPVDLSYQLGDTVPSLYPGARLVFTLDEFNCATEVNLLPERRQIDGARQQRQRELLQERRRGQPPGVPAAGEDARFQKS